MENRDYNTGMIDAAVLNAMTSLVDMYPEGTVHGTFGEETANEVAGMVTAAMYIDAITFRQYQIINRVLQHLIYGCEIDLSNVVDE